MLLRIGLMALSLTLDVWLKDEPPYDDSHLIPVRRELADEDNAYELFRQAGEIQKWPEDQKRLWDLQVPLKWYNWDAHPFEGRLKWDADFVEGVLADNEETFNLLAQGLQKKALQVPEVKSIQPEMSHICSWERLANLNWFRSTHFFNTGRHHEAVGAAMEMLRFGFMAENAEGPLTVFLIGNACKLHGLYCLDEMLPGLDLTSDELKQTVKELDNYRITEQAVKALATAEYMIDANTLASIRAERVMFLKPNKTKRLFAEVFENLIYNMNHHATDRREHSDEIRQALDAIRKQQELKMLIDGNSLGIILLSMKTPVCDNIAVYKHKAEVSLHTTRLLIALKAYKLDHGELPDTLDTLVPDYINSVPIDDFDGKPLRYDPVLRIIWSVGENLKDDAGDEESDIIVKIK